LADQNIIDQRQLGEVRGGPKIIGLEPKFVHRLAIEGDGLIRVADD
jgi:hypothetical protein